MRGVRNGQTHTRKKERGTNTITRISTYGAAMVHIHRHHHHHSIPNSVLFSAIEVINVISAMLAMLVCLVSVSVPEWASASASFVHVCVCVIS